MTLSVLDPVLTIRNHYIHARGMMEVPEYFPTQTAAAPYTYVHPLEAEMASHTKGFYFSQMASSFPQLQTLYVNNLLQN